MFQTTNNILDTIIFSEEDIHKIIKNLDPNKAHGNDMISIHVINFAFPYVNPLKFFFKIAYFRASFCQNRKRQMLFLHLKRVTNSAKNIIVQFLFSRFAVKCLNGYFIKTCFHFFQKTT